VSRRAAPRGRPGRRRRRPLHTSEHPHQRLFEALVEVDELAASRAPCRPGRRAAAAARLPAGALGLLVAVEVELASTGRATALDGKMRARGRQEVLPLARVEQVGPHRGGRTRATAGRARPAVCELLGPVRDERRPVGAERRTSGARTRGSRQRLGGRYTAASEGVAIRDRSRALRPGAPAQRPSSANARASARRAGQQGGASSALFTGARRRRSRDHGPFPRPGFASASRIRGSSERNSLVEEHPDCSRSTAPGREVVGADGERDSRRRMLISRF